MEGSSSPASLRAEAEEISQKKMLVGKQSNLPNPPSRPGHPNSSMRALYNALYRAYGPQGWWPADTPLEVIIGAYLTQNTSWRAVERSIANLRERGVLCLEGLRRTGAEELRLLIRPSGYMVRKAAALKAFIAFLDQEHAGSLDRLAALPTLLARRQLLALPGVGQETADAILLYALGHPVMVADEYLRRVASRHGLAPPGAKYEQLQALARAAFAGEAPGAYVPLAKEFHALIVAVGKNHCRPQPLCQGCPLECSLEIAERHKPGELSSHQTIAAFQSGKLGR